MFEVSHKSWFRVSQGRQSGASSPTSACSVCQFRLPRMQVHRCRFVDWVPAAVSSLAFHQDGAVLAVARESGDIELWNVENGWHFEKV